MLTCLLATNAMPAQNNVEMDRTDICKENYRTLFGREALTGEGSDPEMMAILQKFIFGEVFTTGDLTLKQREMITCITLATMQTLPQLKAHAAAALNVGVTPEELRETMYLTAPFIGFPKMLNAVGAINEVFAGRGIDLPLPGQTTVTEESRHATGEEIQQRLYPGGISGAMDGVPGDPRRGHCTMSSVHRLPCSHKGPEDHRGRWQRTITRRQPCQDIQDKGRQETV